MNDTGQVMLRCGGEGEAAVVEHTLQHAYRWCVYRGTSLIRNSLSPSDHQRALGIVLL